MRSKGDGTRSDDFIAFGHVGYLTWDNHSLLSGPSTTARWLLVLVPVCLVAGYVLGRFSRSATTPSSSEARPDA